MLDPAMSACRHLGRATFASPIGDSLAAAGAVSPMTEAEQYDSALTRVTDALLCSQLTSDSVPDGQQLAAATRDALAEHDGWDGCMRAAALAHIGDETAATERLLWCQRIAIDAFRHGVDGRRRSDE